MRRRIANIVLSSLVFFLQPIFAGNVHIVEQKEGRLRLQLIAEPPEIETVVQEQVVRSRLSVKDWPLTIDGEGHCYPYCPVILNLGSGAAHVEISSVSDTRLKMAPPILYNESAVGLDSATVPMISAATDSTNSIVSLSYIGQYKGNHLWSAHIFPYRYDSRSGELIYHGQIVFDVVAETGKLQSSKLIPPEEVEFLNKLGVISMTTRKSAISPEKQLAKKYADQSERWKIVVKEEGIYRVTGQDLLDAGVNLLSIDFRNLRLTNNDRDVSLFPSGWRDGQFDQQDFFEFWGEPNRRTFQQKAPDLYQDPYSDERIYWLSWEKRGLWMAEESGQITDLQPGQYVRPYSFLETRHIEKDAYYDRLSSVEIDSLRDHWFFDSGISSGKKVDYAFDLWYPDTQSPLSISARVMFSGRTTVVNIPHSVSVFLNDSYLFSQTWFGQKIADLSTAPENVISAAAVQHGSNQLSVVNNVLPQTYDFVMLNWFEVTYPRLYRAHDDYIKFSVPPSMPGGKFLFRIDGFKNANIDIYKLYQSKINGGVVESITDFNNFTSLQMSFQNDVFSPDVEFVAVSETAKKKPLKIVHDQPTFLKNNQLAADYVIIAHRRFMKTQALQDLISMRQSQGHHVLAVDVEDVFDEFNYGHASSYAIRDFLKWAYLNWQEPRLQYVLLVGDGSYIRRAADGDTLDLVPVHMRQTMVYGAAASDYWYSLLSGDDEIPEIYIGRFPVRDEAELERLVNKLVRYETDPPAGDWPNRFLIIGGNGDDFRSQGIALSKIMPIQFNTRMLFSTRDKTAPVDPYFGGTSDLLDYFSSGCSVMTFHGHGGGAIWADNGLLRYEDYSRIFTRGKHTFVLSMTCFTGSFESPSYESLSDALLFASDEGAVAMLGASGVGWTWNDYFLQTELMKQVYSNPDMTLGQMIAAGKISYLVHYQTSQAVSQVNQYHLLGDPATKLRLPQKTVPVTLDQSIALIGDTLTAVSRLPFALGEGVFDLEDSLKIIISSSPASRSDSTAAANLVVKENFIGETGLVRFYGADELNRTIVHGATTLALKGVVFDSAYVYRTPEDSLAFFAQIRSRDALREVWCYTLNDSILMQPLGDDWFKSQHAVFVAFSGFQFSYHFKATDSANRQVTSRLYKHYINLNVDVEITENAVRFAGQEWVALESLIQNKSSNEVSDLPVLYRVKAPPDTSWRIVGRDTVSINAFASAVSRIKYAPAPGVLQVEVTLDPDSTIKEDNKLNNQIVASLTPTYFQATSSGFLLNGEYRTILAYNDHLSLELPGGALDKNAVLSLSPAEVVKIHQQPDFQHLPGTPAFNIEFLLNDVVLRKPAAVFLQLAADSTVTDSVRQTWKLYRFTKQTKKWIKCDSRLQGDQLIAQEMILGPVAVLVTQDEQPPDILIAIDGQPYVDHKWASDEPRIGIRLQDLNGIDISSGRTNIALNGRPVDASEIALPDSIIDGNQIIISYNPKLTPGEQILTVQATDCNQNVSDVKEFYFRIAQEFDIQMLGNYPNPFKQETRFAYVFTAPAEEMSIKVFTASGRLIRAIQPPDILDDPNPLSADYHEVFWDGLDEEGYEVANGVYFYRLSAKSGGKTRSVNGKIAKIM